MLIGDYSFYFVNFSLYVCLYVVVGQGMKGGEWWKHGRGIYLLGYQLSSIDQQFVMASSYIWIYGLSYDIYWIDYMFMVVCIMLWVIQIYR